MKERPILFTDEMVRAILAGTKTQTRRAYKARNGGIWPNRNDKPGMAQAVKNCPFGQAGDRLWVREAFARIDGQTRPWIETDYRATYEHGFRLGDSLGIKKRWSPSIHMPRHASRITLEITSVGVERLQDISESDAEAEGVTNSLHLPGGRFARENFAHLWWTIHGDGSWDANPWVWVVCFKQIYDTAGGM